MKKVIVWMYNNGILHLFVWLFTGVIGSAHRYVSPMFDKWIDTKNLEVIQRGYEPTVFDFLSYTPSFVFFIETVVALGCVGCFILFSWLLRRKLPTLVRAFISLLPFVLVVYGVFVTSKDLLSNIHWGFYMFAVHNVVWFVYSGFIIRSVWKINRL